MVGAEYRLRPNHDHLGSANDLARCPDGVLQLIATH